MGDFRPTPTIRPTPLPAPTAASSDMCAASGAEFTRSACWPGVFVLDFLLGDWDLDDDRPRLLAKKRLWSGVDVDKSV